MIAQAVAPAATGPILSWADRAVEAGVLFLLVFTPLAFGTVQPWSEAVAGVVILVMALAWVAGMVANWEVRVELPPGWLPASLFLALVFLQLVPLPLGSVRLVSPVAGAARDAAAAYGLPVGLVPLSMDPHATLREGTKLLLAAVFFLAVYNTYRTRAQADRAVWTMVVVASAVALFGIAQRMAWNGRLYWIGPVAPHSEAFGPFVNRAHFAGLVVVVVPMALALWLSRARKPARRRPERRPTWQDRLHRWSAGEAGAVRLVPLLILLMGGAALVSRSRGGLVALLAALVAMVGLASRRRTGSRPAKRLALMAALVVLAGAWIGGDVLYGTVERLAEEVGRPAESGRLQIWANALALWRGSPLVGTGLGTFGAAFPLVRTLDAPVAYTHAESDWVQLLTDTGALGLVLAAAAVAVVAAALLRREREAAHPRTRAFALAGCVALVGWAVQGIGNYTLPLMSGLLYLAAAVGPVLRGAE